MLGLLGLQIRDGALELLHGVVHLGVVVLGVGVVFVGRELGLQLGGQIELRFVLVLVCGRGLRDLEQLRTLAAFGEAALRLQVLLLDHEVLR